MRAKLLIAILVIFLVGAVKQAVSDDVALRMLGSEDWIDVTVVTKLNQGAGSGWDSDLLDGMTAAEFVYMINVGNLVLVEAVYADPENMGVLLYYDAAQNLYLVATTDLPGDNEIPKYDDATGLITWEADATSAAGAVPVSFTMEWTSGDEYFQHFHLKVGTGVTPESGSFAVDAESKDSQTNWTYWGGVNLVAVDSTGVSYVYDTLRAQYKVASGIMSAGTDYNVWRRVQNVDSTIYGDWKWLGAISM